MAPLIFLLLIISGAVVKIAAKTQVTIYDNSNYGGGSATCSNLEDYSYCYFTTMNDKMTSFKIDSGSCVIMYEHGGQNWAPSGLSFWSDRDTSNVGSTYNDKISAIKSCGQFTRSLRCPAGTLVKKIEWDAGAILAGNGINLYCYKPENATSYTTKLSTHGGTGTYNGVKTCTGMRGIDFTADNRREIYTNINPICTPDQPAGEKRMCGNKEAVSGISVVKEDYSNYIKRLSLQVYCTKVENIEEICAPADEKQTLFTCDASGAVSPLKCTWAKKVGYGGKTSMSETERNERTFYSEFGFEMGAAGFGLSANFKATLGQSETTGYDWTKTQESTWTEEITFTIEIEAPPGYKTVVSEIYGDCSFMAVRPYHFERNDTCHNPSCGSATFITQEIIPNDQGIIFKSNIPEIVFYNGMNDTNIVNGKNRDYESRNTKNIAQRAEEN